MRAIYDYARTHGIVASHPEVYDASLEDSLNRYDRSAAFAEMEREALPAAEAGWTVLFDLDNRLVTHRNLYVSRSVLILDADGSALFPCTLFPLNSASGTPVAHPQAVVELARILAWTKCWDDDAAARPPWGVDCGDGRGTGCRGPLDRARAALRRAR